MKGLWAFVLFVWHETLGCHDPRVTGKHWVPGEVEPRWDLECDCRATWTNLRSGEPIPKTSR